MNKQETAKVLNELYIYFPSFAKKSTDAEMRNTLNAWARSFEPYDAEDVEKAVQIHVMRGKYFPTVSELLGYIRELKAPSATDLFDTMLEASSSANRVRMECVDLGGFGRVAEYRHYYEYTEIDFRKLPEEIKEYVGDLEGLRKIAQHYKDDPNRCMERFYKELPKIQQALETKKMLKAKREKESE